MSLQDMIDEEPPSTLLRQNATNATDASGVPTNDYVPVRQIQGRVNKSSARQMESWAALGVQCDYEFLTLDVTLESGDVIQVINDAYPQGRFFRVTGFNNDFQPKGNIERHVKYPMTEVRKRGTTFVAVTP